MRTIPVLSVRQPWASAIVMGVKGIENRSWPPPDRIIGKTLLIHSSKKVDDHPNAERLMLTLWPDRPNTQDMPLGALIGAVRVKGCVEADDTTSPWAFGPLCWILEDAVSFDPIPATGALGIFYVPPSIVPKDVRLIT